MPRYAKVSEVKTLIGKPIATQLTDDLDTGQTLDDVIALSIDQAEGVVNAYVSSGGYTVPVKTPVPIEAGLVKSATIWLAICELASRRGAMPDDYGKQCDTYRAMLEQVASGDIQLPLDEGQVNAPRSSTEGQEKVFTRSKFETGTAALRNPDENHSLDVI